MKYRTRSEWGARAPKPGRDTINKAEAQGIAVHYTAEESRDAHDSCDDQVRAIQRFHMDTRGWLDIAYSFLVCKHGTVFEGRGWGVRTAANGTNTGNARYHAVCYMSDDDKNYLDLTAEAKTALAEVIATCDSRDYGSRVVAHQDLKATTCPGPELVAWVRSDGWEDEKPVSGRRPTLRFGDKGRDVGALQRGINRYITEERVGWDRLVVDDDFGPKTENAVERVERREDLKVNGIAGPSVWRAIER